MLPAKLIKNISSLTVIHGLNYFLSLAILPYMLTTYGPVNWGKLVFVQILTNYFIWFTDWGFNKGAIKKISGDKLALKNTTKVFFNYWLAQAILLIISMSVIFGVLLLNKTINGIDRNLIAIASILIVSNVILPTWYFQALEQVAESAFFQFLPKAINVFLVFLFIKNSNDLIEYITIISLSSFFVSVLGILFMLKYNKVKYSKPSFKKAINILKKDFVWFRINIISSLSSLIVPTYLGVFSGMGELGLFNVAEKIKSSAIIIFHPITHSLFPRMNYLFKKSVKEALLLAKRFFVALTFLSGIASGIIFIYSKEILHLLGGDEFTQASSFLRIIAFVPLISTLNSFLNDQIIVPNSNGLIIEKINLLSFLFLCLLVSPFFNLFGISGIGYLLLINEILIFFLNSYKARNVLIFLKLNR